MTDGTADDGAAPDLQAENAGLRARLVQAELRTEAVRAGMVDLDGVRLIDPAAISRLTIFSIISCLQGCTLTVANSIDES